MRQANMEIEGRSKLRTIPSKCSLSITSRRELGTAHLLAEHEHVATRLNMKYQLSFGKFVMVVLGCYFAFEIINAFVKLQSGEIGTIFRKVKQKTLQGI